MHNLRKLLSWNFVFLSLLCLWIALSYISQIIHRHINALHLRSFLVPTVLTVLTAVYGAAWWTVWRGKPSGTVCAIARSPTSTSLSPPILGLTRYFMRLLPCHFLVFCA